ncbi:hypothetical protein MMC34_004890 [Xylographa carneopallida]|nr:hypothetical protein [Xylographa carneopallida]
MPSNSQKSEDSFEIIPAAADFAAKKRRANLPCYLLKPHTRNKDFFPRREIMQSIETVLLPSTRAQGDRPLENLKTFVLTGLGGTGKTEVALEFVFAHQLQYDAVFILHADQSSRLSDEFCQIAIKLGLERPEDKNDPDIIRDIVQSWLANPVKSFIRADSISSVSEDPRREPTLAKWLIVFDNADDPTVLSDFWPSEGHGSVLVTSRDPMAKSQFFFGEAGLEFGPLSIPDAAEFLKRLTREEDRQNSEEASQAIARRLDGLPLAIAQIAAIIRRRNLLLAEFLNLYPDETDLYDLQCLRIGSQRGYEHSIASVWALGDLEDRAIALLNVISFLDPECIQEGILTGTFQGIEIVDYPKTKKEYHQVLPHLLQSSIVHRNASKGELRVHRLVQDVARARMQSSPGLSDTVFDTAVQLVSSNFPFITRGSVGRAHKIDRWTLCAKLLPHITHLKQVYAVISIASDSFRPRVKFADLLNEAGWYLYERTNPVEATPLLDMAQAICEASQEDVTEQLALIHGSRTWVSSLMNQPEKCYHHSKIRLELEEQLFSSRGKATANLAAAYNDLGVSLSMNKLYTKAVPLLNRSKEVRASLEGFRKDHMYNPMYHLALAAWHQGNYDEAANLLLEALRDRTHALGPDDRQSVRTGTLFYALGNVRASQGNLEESFAWHQKAFIHFRATGGETHYYTAHACYRVAEHYFRLQDYHATRNLLDQVLKAYQDRPYYRQELVMTYFLYAELLRRTGKDPQDMMERAAAAFSELFPESRRSAADLTEEDLKGIDAYEF